MSREYRDAALAKAEFYPSEIKSGDCDNIIKEKAMVYSDDVNTVFDKIETDVNDILKAVKRMQNESIADINESIDYVCRDLETLAEKLY